MDYYYVSLCLLFFATNIFWAVLTNKLLNKLMSRNYYDYKVSETVDEKSNKKELSQKEIAKTLESLNLHEDLGALHEIMP